MGSQPVAIATIITSALVAAFVTMVVEYLAKPRLEARKERILQRGKDARTRTQALLNIVNWASIASGGHGDKSDEVLQDAIARVRASALILIEVPRDLAMSGDSTAGRLTASFAGYVWGHILQTAALPPVATLQAMSGPLGDYFDAPRWRWRHRRRCLRAAMDAQPSIARTIALTAAQRSTSTTES